MCSVGSHINRFSSSLFKKGTPEVYSSLPHWCFSMTALSRVHWSWLSHGSQLKFMQILWARLHATRAVLECLVSFGCRLFNVKSILIHINTSVSNISVYHKYTYQGRSSAPPTPWCSSYRKGSLRVTLDYGRQLYLLFL